MMCTMTMQHALKGWEQGLEMRLEARCTCTITYAYTIMPIKVTPKPLPVVL